MKKLLILSVIAFSSIAFAEDMPQPPMGAPNAGEHKHGGMMANLTDEQKSCIKAFGCKMPERPKKDENMPKPEMGEKPDFKEKPEMGKRPEMSEEQKEAMDCMRKAMESCGIQMPERPNKDENGPKPPFGDKPEAPVPPQPAA